MAATGSASALRRFVTWSEATPWATLRFAPRKGATSPSDDASLDDGLRRWRTRLAVRRALVVARRWALIALSLAVVLHALVVGGVIGEPPAIVAPVALFVLGLVLVLRRGLAIETTARLLDERLGLADRLGTAVELGRRPDAAQRPLARRAIADARGTLAPLTATWRARGPAAGREWAGLAVLAAGVVVLAIIGAPATEADTATATHRATRTTASAPSVVAPGRAASTAPQAATPALTTPVKTTKSAPGSNVAPTPRLRNPYAISKSGYKAPPQRLDYQPTPQKQSNVNAGAAAGQRSDDVGSKTAKPSTNAANDTGSSKNFVGVGASSTSGKVSPVGGSSTAGGDAGGGQGAQQAPNSASSAPGALTPGSRPPAGSKPAPAVGGGTQSGGSPSGSATAGQQAGANQLGGATQTQGTESQNLSLEADYAPVKTAQTTKTGGTGDSAGGGGGPGRSTTGTAAGGGGSFGYVPSAARPAASADAPLLLNYAAALTWIKRQQW